MTIRVQADSLLDLFQVVARELFNQFIDSSEIGHALREKIAIEARNEEGLLSEWVIMLLELLRYNRMVAGEFKNDLKIEPNQNFQLKSEVLGELIDAQRHVLKRDLTMARCEKVALRQEGGKYVAEIVLAE